MSIEFARDYAIQACRKPGNALGPAYFDLHLKVVAFYAVALADNLGADREVVEIASYLHDISAVEDIKTLLTHPINSGDIAEKLLLSNGYPYEKAQKVKQCILRHASPVALGKGNAEEVCLSNADAISQIAVPAYWLYFTFCVRKQDFEDGFDWYRNRVEANWKALVPQAKVLAEDKYQIVKKCLEG